jgi:hypothetical protein
MMVAMSAGSAADEALARKLASLDALSRDELTERWAATYGCQPPPGVRRELLAYSFAWHLQAKHLGGLKPETKTLLRRAVAQVERRVVTRHATAPAQSGSGAYCREPGEASEGNNAVGGALSAPPSPAAHRRQTFETPLRRPLLPGARLLRDWQGRTHVVDVVEGGFLYEGRMHRSLSAISKQITGAHWSGPRFFGL